MKECSNSAFHNLTNVLKSTWMNILKNIFLFRLHSIIYQRISEYIIEGNNYSRFHLDSYSRACLFNWQQKVGLCKILSMRRIVDRKYRAWGNLFIFISSQERNRIYFMINFRITTDGLKSRLIRINKLTQLCWWINVKSSKPSSSCKIMR